MIVVGIIAILASLGFVGISRHTDKTRIQKAARDLAQRIARGREIAEAIGPRNNDVDLLTTVNCAPAVPVEQLSVVIDPAGQQYWAPDRVTYDALTDRMTVECNRYDINVDPFFSETRGLGTMVTPNGAITLLFSQTGRLLPASTPAIDRHFEIVRNGIAHERYGYRILQSGIICKSSYPGAVQCNED